MKKVINEWRRFLKEDEEENNSIKNKLMKLITGNNPDNWGQFDELFNILYDAGEVTFEDFEDPIYKNLIKVFMRGDYGNFEKLLKIYLAHATKQQRRYVSSLTSDDEHGGGISRLNPDKDSDVEVYQHFLHVLSPGTLYKLAQTTNNEAIMQAMINRAKAAPIAVTRLVTNPNLPRHMQELLSSQKDRTGHGSWSIGKLIRMKLAKNPIVDPDILDKMADDIEDPVRFAVSANPNVSNETLKKLATDEDRDVSHFSKEALKRRGIKEEQEENPNAEIERKLKKLLAKDQGQFLTLYDQLSDKPVEYFVQDMKFEDLLYMVVGDAKAEICKYSNGNFRTFDE